MSSFGVNELTQLGAYGYTVGGKGTLQNAIVIGSQKFNSGPRMSSEISPVGDFESVDYLCNGRHSTPSCLSDVIEINVIDANCQSMQQVRIRTSTYYRGKVK